MALRLFAYDSTNKAWELDVANGFNIQLNFVFFDLFDITKQQKVFSQSIVLPSTKNNDAFFLDAYDHKSNLFYNQKKYIKAYVTNQADTYIDCNLVITSVKKVRGRYEYNAVLIGDSATIVSLLGDKKIRDILSSQTFDYDTSTYINNYTSQNDVGIAIVDNNDPYFNYLIGGGLNGIGIHNNSLVPVLRLNYVLNQIISSIGMSIHPNSKIYDTTNYPFFDKLYISGDNTKWKEEFSGVKQFTGYGTATWNFPATLLNSNTIARYQLMDTITNFNNEVYDPNNIHNTLTDKFTTTTGNWKCEQNFKIKISIKFSSATGANFVVGQKLTDYFKFVLKTYQYVSAINNTLINTHTTLISPIVTSVSSLFGIKIVTCDVTIDIHDVFTLPVNSASYELAFDSATYINNSNVSGFVSSPDNYIDWYGSQSSVSMYNQTLVVFNSTTNISQGLLFKPDTLASDILVDVVKAFGLILSVDLLSKKIMIDTFDSYFDTNNIIDANDLIDSSNIEVVLNHEYQNKRQRYQWADNKDFYLNTHKENTGQTYGGRRVEFDTDYSNSEQTISTKLISTTAMVAINNNFIKNDVSLFENGVKKYNPSPNIRLYCFNGMFNAATYVDYYTGSGTTITKIAMYSHFHTTDAFTWTNINDGYKTPIVNINFGFPEVLWYVNGSGYYTTNNDIYRLFHHKKNMILNSQNSRILRCKLFIDNTMRDILKHKRILFYDGSYFFINRINNFTDFGNITDVELIKLFNVDLYDTIQPIDNSAFGNDTSTARMMSVTNDGLNITANALSANSIVCRNGFVNTTTRVFNIRYDQVFEETFNDEVIDVYTIIINQLPDNSFQIYINNLLDETILSTTTYTMKRKPLGQYTRMSMNTTIAIPVNPLNTQGNITLVVLTTKLK